VQGLPGCLPWGVIVAFLNDFLQSEGLSKRGATLIIVIFGSGGLLGSIIAGLAGQALYNWRKGALPVFTGLSVWAGMPLLFAIINSKLAVSLPMPLLLPLLFLGGAVASIASVVIRPLIMNVNLPETRGIALAFQVCFAHYESYFCALQCSRVSMCMPPHRSLCGCACDVCVLTLLHSAI
jgi:sugar phosphate permease